MTMSTDSSAARAQFFRWRTRRSDDACWAYCAQFIENNLSTQSRMTWEIFARWEWMTKKSRARAEGFWQSLDDPHRLTQCVQGCTNTVRQQTAAQIAIMQNWPEWNWVVLSAQNTNRTPTRFSLHLLETLASLGKLTPSVGELMVRQLAAKVTTCIITTRCTIASVCPRDVEAIIEQVKSSRRRAPSFPPHPPPRTSPSIEQGRQPAEPLLDRSSDDGFVMPNDDDNNTAPTVGSTAVEANASQTEVQQEDLQPAASDTLRPGRRPAKSRESRLRDMFTRWLEMDKRAADHSDLAAEASRISQQWADLNLGNLLGSLPAHWRAENASASGDES